jgi:hypothetical protein
MVEKYKLGAACSATHSMTLAVGLGNIKSETTLVSRTIITVTSVELGRFPHGSTRRKV